MTCRCKAFAMVGVQVGMEGGEVGVCWDWGRSGKERRSRGRFEGGGVETVGCPVPRCYKRLQSMPVYLILLPELRFQTKRIVRCRCRDLLPVC